LPDTYLETNLKALARRPRSRIRYAK